MKVTNIKGFFDVRVYAEGKQREQLKLKGDDETVYFLARFKAGDVPAGLEQFVTAYTAKDGTEHARVKFKVGSRAAWYGPDGAPCARPTNTDLEADRWQVSLDFVNLPTDPENPKKACGLWVNAIQAMRLERYEFAPMTQVTPPFAAASEPNEADTSDPFE